MKGETTKLVSRAIAKLNRQLKKGKSKSLVAYLKAMGRLHRYSAGNILLIHLQKPDATHVAGYGTWRRMGRYVRRGEKAIRIIAPVLLKNDEEDRKSSREEADHEDGNDEIAAFKQACVFDVSQTEGKTMPALSQTSGNPKQCLDKLRSFIEASGIKIAYREPTWSAEGSSTGGAILIKSDLSSAEEFSVLVHEYAHEQLHHDENDIKQRKVRETEAEAAAFVVCHAIGLNTNTASSDYIQLYGGDRKTLTASLARIRQVAATLLTALSNPSRRKEPVAVITHV